MIARGLLASVVVRWILANVLPQVFLVAATWAYVSVQGMTAFGLVVSGILTRVPHPFWLVVGAVYVVMMICMRGAVLRPLVPRFSIAGWIAVAVVTSVIVLVLTGGGSLIGIVIAKGLTAGRALEPPPIGLPMPVVTVLLVLVAELMGGVLGIIPGAVIGTLEALVVGRSSRNMSIWILGTIGAWSMIFALVMLHLVLVGLYPRVSANVLTATAMSMPVVFGLATALGTLPAMARIARSEPNSG